MEKVGGAGFSRAITFSEIARSLDVINNYLQMSTLVFPSVLSIGEQQKSDGGVRYIVTVMEHY